MAIGFIVWAHHMYTCRHVVFGAGSISSLATMVIAVPTGVKIFSWIATMWGGSIESRRRWCGRSASSSLFTVGGVTGVVLANAAVDRVPAGHLLRRRVTSTTRCRSASTFGYLRRLVLLVPEDDVATSTPKSFGKLHFWIAFVGANMIFFPQHFLGLAGMPRRIADYP